MTMIGENAIDNKIHFDQSLSLVTVGGACVRSGTYVWLNCVEADDGYRLESVKAHVVRELPLGVDIIFGMDVISRSGLVVGDAGRSVKLGSVSAVNVVNPDDMVEKTDVKVTDADFDAYFKNGKWIVSWHWKEGSPNFECARRPKNLIKEEDADGCEAEILDWIKDGILVKHDLSRDGTIKHYLPIIAVRQEKGAISKVRPVLDYRCMNTLIESHTRGASTCADQIREWRQWGQRCGLVDLKRAYLQVHIDPRLWVFQGVRWQGEDYLLTRLGFGLSSAPKIMSSIVKFVLQEKPISGKGVSSYIDDLYVNEDIVSVETVMSHLAGWGLESKPPERVGLKDVRVLGLKVDGHFRWKRDGEIPRIEAYLSKGHLTRREVHGIAGEWLGHYPVAGWLRVATAVLQRLTAEEKIDWDDQVSNAVEHIVREIDKRLRQCDPVRGNWLVHSNSALRLWTDASSLAVGIAVEIDGDIVEDAAWLRRKGDSSHINVSELDAVVKGLNVAQRWGRREIEIVTDSASVYRWLQAIIERSCNIRTRSLYQILIRRRLDIIEEIINEANYHVSVKWIKSNENLADSLTRVPGTWVKEREPKESLMAVTFRDVQDLHAISHFGVDKTLALAREKFEDVSKHLVKRVVSRCDACARIDPATKFRANRGSLSTNQTWSRLACDITHVYNVPYLTAIDTCSRFTVWRRLSSESSREVVQQVRGIFCEFGPPNSIMTDNALVFRSREFVALLDSWNVEQVLSCAYRSQGNGIIERMHRSVKRAVARSGRSVEETTFWVNNTKRAWQTVTAYEMVFSARARKPGISNERIEIQRPDTSGLPPCRAPDKMENPFLVGDRVYLRDPTGKCVNVWSGPKVVTEVRSDVTIVLDNDGVSRHISHVRRVPENRSDDLGVDAVDEGLEVTVGSSDDNPEPELRRSSRLRRRPAWHEDYEMG